MIVIYNRWIPFGDFLAINLFGIIFCRKGHGKLSKEDLNHEYIHTLQQRELLYVGFYLLYIIEGLIKVIRHRSLIKGYYAISFEKEAYKHQYDLTYSKHRKHYAWMSL